MAKNENDEELLGIKRTTIGQRVRYEEKQKEIDIQEALLKMTPQQKKFAQTYIETEDKNLARDLAGYSKNTPAQNVLSIPNVQVVVSKTQVELWDRFKDYAEKALQVQVDMLDNPHVSFKVKLDASNSILDRAGYKPADRKEIVGAIGTIAVESRAVNEFAQRARELLMQKGLVDTDDIVDAVIVDDN